MMKEYFKKLFEKVHFFIFVLFAKTNFSAQPYIAPKTNLGLFRKITEEEKNKKMYLASNDKVKQFREDNT